MQIREVIAEFHFDCQVRKLSPKTIALYETIKALSKIQTSPNKYVEVWFQKTFPNWQNQVNFNNDGSMTFVTKSDEQKKADAPAIAAHAENQAANISTLDRAA